MKPPESERNGCIECGRPRQESFPPFSRSQSALAAWEIGPCDSHAIFSSLSGGTLEVFSGLPLEVLSSFLCCSPFFFRPPSFLFLGINRSRWEDSTRGERIRLFPFSPRPRGTNGRRTQKLPSAGRQTGGQRTNQPLLAIGGCGHGILFQGWKYFVKFWGEGQLNALQTLNPNFCFQDRHSAR